MANEPLAVTPPVGSAGVRSPADPYHQHQHERASFAVEKSIAGTAHAKEAEELELEDALHGPKRKRFFCWRLTKKKWIAACVASLLVVIAAALLIVFFAVIPSIFQSFANKVELQVNYLDLKTLSADPASREVDVELSVRIKHDGSRDARIDEAMVRMFYGGKYFGTLRLPEQHLMKGQKEFDLLIRDTAVVEDVDVFNQLAVGAVTKQSISIDAKAEVKAHAAGLSYGGLDLNRQLAVKVLDNFRDPAPVVNQIALKACERDAYKLQINATIDNDSQLGLDGIGQLNMSVYYQQGFLGHAVSQDAKRGLPRGVNVMLFDVTVSKDPKTMGVMMQMLGGLLGLNAQFYITGDNPYATRAVLLQGALRSLNMSILYTDVTPLDLKAAPERESPTGTTSPPPAPRRGNRRDSLVRSSSHPSGAVPVRPGAGLAGSALKPLAAPVTPTPSLRSVVFGSCSDVLSVVVAVLFERIKATASYSWDSTAVTVDCTTVRKAKLLFVQLLEKAQRGRGEWQGFSSDSRRRSALGLDAGSTPTDVLVAALEGLSNDEVLAVLHELMDVCFRSLRGAVISPSVYAAHRGKLQSFMFPIEGASPCPPALHTLLGLRTLLHDAGRDEQCVLLRLLCLWNAMALTATSTDLHRIVDEHHHVVFSESSEMEFMTARGTPSRPDPLARDLLLLLIHYRDILFSELEFYAIRSEMQFLPSASLRDEAEAEAPASTPPMATMIHLSPPFASHEVRREWIDSPSDGTDSTSSSSRRRHRAKKALTPKKLETAAFSRIPRGPVPTKRTTADASTNPSPPPTPASRASLQSNDRPSQELSKSSAITVSIAATTVCALATVALLAFRRATRS
ncbi:hypothetical protein P43SY_002778 [Pythium insidiosum]|uniref:Uncharacterized protein n=1 Tax=Pythium insidiosum TaxID=114742 RepID=A0AAD5LRG3_PYTIN|nr:hypothetical protein P43SY_002778 [Pythium insidiosum]